MINLVVSCSSTNQEGKPKGFYDIYISLAPFFHLKQAIHHLYIPPSGGLSALVRPSLEHCIQL